MFASRIFGSSPNRAAALAQYRRRARFYDLELAVLEPVRRKAIAKLNLTPGDTVLDVGCGTGLSLAALQKAVGPKGRVIGIEQSPEMIALARQRVAQHGWGNVSLVNASVEAADIGGKASAVLFNFTHDILRCDAAIANVRHSLRPGARVVASGLKWASLWSGPVNMVVLSAALHSVSSLEGMQQPWSRLASIMGPLNVQSLYAGGVYVASGNVRA